MIQIVSQISDIVFVHYTVSVNIGSLVRIGGRAILVKIIQQKRNIGRIDDTITVGIAANISWTVAQVAHTVAVTVELVGIVNVRAVILWTNVLGMIRIAETIAIGIDTRSSRLLSFAERIRITQQTKRI